MIQYKKYKPTQFDYHVETEYEDWYVAPVMITRDTEEYSLDYSNYYSLLEILEKENEDDYTELSFGHWACGWFNIILIKPNTELYKKVEEIEKGLQEYPVINEENYSENYYYYAVNQWEDEYYREEYCKENNIEMVEDMEMPDGFINWCCLD